MISNDGECVFYGVLDIFSKGLFALGLVYIARRLDFKRLGLWMHDHGRISPSYGGESGYQEKMKVAPGVSGTSVGRDSGVGNDAYGPRVVPGPGEARVVGETTTAAATHPIGV